MKKINEAPGSDASLPNLAVPSTRRAWAALGMGWRLQEFQARSLKSFPRAASFLSVALNLLLPRPLPPVVSALLSTLWVPHSASLEGGFLKSSSSPTVSSRSGLYLLSWWWLSTGSRGCGHIKVHARGRHLLLRGRGVWKI